MPKKTKIIYKKLGREQAEGQAISHSFAPVDGVIELDERLIGKRLFIALLHESLHLSLPSTHEDEIARIEKEVAAILWDEIKKHPEKYLKGIIK